MGCKCITSNDEQNGEIHKLSQDEYIYEIYQKFNQNDPSNSNNENNYDENDIINNLIKSDINFGRENNENTKVSRNSKYANYSERIIELINNIRQDPASYAEIIEDSIRNIVDDNNKNDYTKNRIIYKQKVKVALNKGKEAFLEAAEILRNIDPLPPLEFVSEMCIPLPETEEELRDPSFLKSQVKELKDEGIFIDVYFKDLIKVPEVSALLMVVDDSYKNTGKKRKALLNKDFKYIGVNSKFIGKSFVAYLAFSK